MAKVATRPPQMSMPAAPVAWPPDPTPVIPTSFPLDKCPDFLVRLTNFLQQAEMMNFYWDPTVPSGLNCLTFIGLLCQMQTGTNPYYYLASQLQYNTMAGAMNALITNFGVTTIGALGDLIFQERPLVFVQPGDVCIVNDGNGGQAGGVCLPPNFYALMPSTGYTKVDTDQVIKAWDPCSFRVPDSLGHLCLTTGCPEAVAGFGGVYL